MPLFIRKIEEHKWLQNNILDGEDVSADAITGCLRTMDNTLSLWRIESEDELNDAILAIVSEFRKADTIDIVKIDPAYFDDNGLTYTASLGITAYDSFKDRHYDLTGLNYPKLGLVSKIIVQCISEKRSIKIRRKEIKCLILSSLADGKLSKEKLKPELVKDLKIDA